MYSTVGLDRWNSVAAVLLASHAACTAACAAACAAACCRCTSPAPRLLLPSSSMQQTSLMPEVPGRINCCGR
jgi:hypothetical protein